MFREALETARRERMPALITTMGPHRVAALPVRIEGNRVDLLAWEPRHTERRRLRLLTCSVQDVKQLHVPDRPDDLEAGAFWTFDPVPPASGLEEDVESSLATLERWFLLMRFGCYATFDYAKAGQPAVARRVRWARLDGDRLRCSDMDREAPRSFVLGSASQCVLEPAPRWDADAGDYVMPDGFEADRYVEPQR